MASPARKKTKTIQEYADENDQLKRELQESSMLSVLPGDAAIPIPPLECVGSGKSHQYPKNEMAAEVEKQFVVPDLLDVDGRLSLSLGRKTSGLRTLIKNSDGVLHYENEYDFHDFVQQALRDARAISNDIISKQAAKSGFSDPMRLGVRRESPLFSSILDHVVVFDIASNAPVFSVETKQVWKKLSPKVFGQVYDQLCEMQAKGHPNPFGALTCFDKTFIVWLENSSSQNVLNNLKAEEYSSQRISRIVGGLPGAHDAAHDLSTSHEQPCTQSPVREKAADDDAMFPHEGFAPTKIRQVTRSANFGADELVGAFVSAIFCSLDGFQHPRVIKSFRLNQKVEEEALCLDSNSHEWGMLRTTYQGIKKKKWWSSPPKSLYLVDHLGKGTTSKVYRALTEDGYECVVKVYVKRRGDDKKFLSKNEFDANAKAAVTREVQMYKTIYGGELKGYVRLDGL